ncbi:hypothetical protein NDU88_001561 [Pleurodeles waltl]|uniref:Uncharacterized protein n=1 Tax=Pleurodeles waltl TaxID=8319 RepID=A0AAV7UWF1_PLEWA|nr:hypothetical protein NDU88_001561 [Pleurodeles waltl]
MSHRAEDKLSPQHCVGPLAPQDPREAKGAPSPPQLVIRGPITPLGTPGGFHRTWESEATWCLFSCGPPGPVPLWPDCRRRLLRCRSAPCLCGLTAQTPPTWPLRTARALSAAYADRSPSRTTGRLSDRSTCPRVPLVPHDPRGALTGGGPGPLSSCKGPGGRAHGHTSGYATIWPQPPICSF